MPNLRSEAFGGGDQTWLANTHGACDSITANLDLASFTKATHYPGGFIPSGTAVDYADPKSVKPFTGTGDLGFVRFDVPVAADATDQAAAVLTHGIVKPDRLPQTLTIPTPAPAGFTFLKGADA